jgi:acetyl-CoA decarbonylase/synthase complex subunit gamma
MALTIMDIYKVLPKSNCKECGVQTCMAFAMQVAATKMALEDCPRISTEAQSQFSEASQAPMKLIKLGTGENVFEFGQEKAMFRHEEKFQHKCGISVRIPGSLTNDEMLLKVDEINKSIFTRIGEELRVSLIALEIDNCDNPEERANLAAKNTQLPIILIGENPIKMKAAVGAISDKKPLIFKAVSANIDDFADIAKNAKVALAIGGENLEEKADLIEKAKSKGVEDMVLAFDSKSPGETVRSLTKTRRLALSKSFRTFGYPAIVEINEENDEMAAVLASTFSTKYAGIVIMDSLEPEVLLPVMTSIQNIYTDPQVPSAVQSKLYEIGSPHENSPVMFTTNFSLTYFSVASEVERSKISAYICVVDTEGLGVLNSYAGDKISEEKVAKTLLAQKVAEKVKHRKLIIPGLLAIFKGELEEKSGWEVIVGTHNARAIPAFLNKLIDEGVYK